MLKLYDFICENAPSDDSVFYILAKHIWDGWLKTKRDPKEKQAQANYREKYNIDPDNPRAGYIRFAKHELYPPEKNSKEIIKRSEWDLKGICGETKEQIIHPHFEKMKKWFFDNYKRNNDILVIFPCAIKKPYFTDHFYRWYVERYSSVCDFAYVSNPGIIPNEYCNYYPFRYYEWDEHNEDHHGNNEQGPLMDYYDDITQKRFLEWVKHFGYKRVLIAMPHPYSAKFALNARRDNPENINDKMVILCDEAYVNKLRKEYPQFKNKGLIYTRILGLDTFKDHFHRMVCKELSDDEVKQLDYEIAKFEYSKSHKEPDKASKTEILQWYKEQEQKKDAK